MPERAPTIPIMTGRSGRRIGPRPRWRRLRLGWAGRKADSHRDGIPLAGPILAFPPVNVGPQ